MLNENYSGKVLECGLDEAGRGCGAGPVVAAAVILPKGFYHSKLKDSKKMTESQKREVFQYIKEHAISYSVDVSTPQEIDNINILQATMLAMHRAIDGLNVKEWDNSRKISNTNINKDWANKQTDIKTNILNPKTPEPFTGLSFDQVLGRRF